jgi:nitrogen regulatory protein PII
MQKLEVIIDKSFLRRLLEIFDSAGVEGYSAMDVVKGKGEKNAESSDGSIIANNLYIISLVEMPMIEKLKFQITALLNETGGVMVISTPDSVFVK